MTEAEAIDSDGSWSRETVMILVSWLFIGVGIFALVVPDLSINFISILGITAPTRFVGPELLSGLMLIVGGMTIQGVAAVLEGEGVFLDGE